uniref:Uncharacterized protein n=1 Tax=Anguilla anguilla TaxID=7936 RepID=A0A0E9XAR4_ANGAN
MEPDPPLHKYRTPVDSGKGRSVELCICSKHRDGQSGGILCEEDKCLRGRRHLSYLLM